MDRNAGDEVEIDIRPNDEAAGDGPGAGRRPQLQQEPADTGLGGAGVANCSRFRARSFNASISTRYRGGLTVTAVRPESPADEQGIRPGDVLVGMHIWETISLENVRYVLNRPDFASLEPLKFYILRENEPQTLYGFLTVSHQRR